MIPRIIVILALIATATTSVAGYGNRRVVRTLAPPPISDAGSQTRRSRSGDARAGPKALKLGIGVSCVIAQGDVQSYRVYVKAAEFIYVVIRERAIALKVSLFAPDNKKLVETSAAGSIQDPVSLLYITNLAGEYRIEVGPADSTAGPGGYEITLQARRPRLAKDAKLIAVQTAFTEALQLYDQPKPESYRNALKKFIEAQAGYAELGMMQEAGMVLSASGHTCTLLNDSAKAIEYYGQALAIKQQAKDRSGEARVLLLMGNAFGEMGRRDRTIQYCEQALAVSRDIKDQAGEGRALCDLAGAYGEQNQYGLARRYFEQGLTTSQKCRDLVAVRTELYDLALICGFLKDFHKAIDYYFQFLDLCRESGYTANMGTPLQGLAAAYENLRQYDKSMSYNEKALAAFIQEKNRLGEAASLLGLGNANYGLSRFEKAIGYYDRALPICREIHKLDYEATALDRLGISNFSLGHYEDAARFGEQAVATYRILRDRAGEGRGLNNVGNAYRSVSQYENAITSYSQALAVAHETGNRSFEGTVLNNLANCHNSVGRYEKAIGYYERALAIFRDASDRTLEGQVLTNLGEDYGALGQSERAIGSYNQALAIFAKAGDHQDQSAALNNLGNAYDSLQQHDKAIAYYKRALAIHRELKDRAGEGTVLGDLGSSYFSLNQYTKALTYYEYALAILRDVGDQAAQAGVLANLMSAWRALKRPTLAIVCGKEAINIYQEIRRNIRTRRRLRASFVRSRESIYRELAGLLISEGRLGEAERVLDFLKAEEYAKIVRGERTDSDTMDFTPSEMEAMNIDGELASIGKEHGDLEAQMEEGKLTVAGRERLDRINGELMPAVNHMFDAQADKIAEEFGNHSGKTADSLHTRDIQGVVSELGPGTVAIYTLVSREEGWVILVTADFRKAYSIDVKGLPETVLVLRQALRDDRYDPLPTAQKLYRMLMLQPQRVGPTLAADLRTYGARTIMWSLDGVLRYVPIAALHDGQRYMVEQYDNVVFTTDQWLRDKSDLAHWTGLGLGVSVERDGFPALQGAERELKAIIREKGETTGGVMEGVRILNDQFTQKKMLGELEEGYRVVHIATHFSYDPVNNDNSVLLLGDGKLRLGDLKNFTNIFEKVDLLALSACDTASLGKDNGKDAEGLAYQAQALGAKAVLASLWPVADVGAEVLMKEFYAIRIKHPEISKAEALRQAQLELLHGVQLRGAEPIANRAAAVGTISPDNQTSLTAFKLNPAAPYSHPYYWAPFILIGNWK